MAHMHQIEDEDRVHQILVERGPRSKRSIKMCVALSLLGFVLLVVCGLTSTGSPVDEVGLAMFLAFGAMAVNGALWSAGRRR
jgi:threonine/homoserine efflux transporter RhtA